MAEVNIISLITLLIFFNSNAIVLGTEPIFATCQTILLGHQ